MYLAGLFEYPLRVSYVAYTDWESRGWVHSCATMYFYGLYVKQCQQVHVELHTQCFMMHFHIVWSSWMLYHSWNFAYLCFCAVKSVWRCSCISCVLCWRLTNTTSVCSLARVSLTLSWTHSPLYSIRAQREASVSVWEGGGDMSKYLN